jgi:hypothetical protein
MNKLIQKLIKADIKRSPELDGDICPGEKVNVYTAETDKFLCKIWNSSNNNSFDKSIVCARIADELLEDENNTGGRVDYNFNEIMYEIEEK